MPATNHLQKAESLLEAESRCAGSLGDVVLSVIDFLLALRGSRRTNTDLNLADHIEAAMHDQQHRRSSALFLIRCLGVPDVIDENNENVGQHIYRKLVDLIEQAAPDIADTVHLAEKKQTIDKIEALRDVHRKCIDLLELLRTLPTRPEEYAARKQDILRLLNNKFLKAYLNNYDFTSLSNIIREFINGISDLLATSDATFGPKLQHLIEKVHAEVQAAESRSDFLVRLAFLPFLRETSEVLRQIDRQSTDRFKCTLRPRRPAPNVVERRFRLHEANQIVKVSIPLVNDGPGVAIDVAAQIVNVGGEIALAEGPMDIGTLPPGEFALGFNILIGEPCHEVRLLVEIEWRTARGSDKQTLAFEAVLLAQNPNIDWDNLESSDLYSTEVAQGDEFVGRRGKVMALANRLRKQRIQSSYITGQKRVGKTSLALAVQDLLAKEENAEARIEFIYLEYGDYARQQADTTVEALGNAIAQRLLSRVPEKDRHVNLDFKGTLAPLNQIAQLLSNLFPNWRYVLVLDEFDEIHPEMYRFGSLAEAFFSNLRTLSAKRNVALVLVGGENMPFIMGAQGDQLNKLIREPLDYFSRSDEWEDFCDLARQKGTVPLNWYESALAELFNYTNGHPYYTKLVCGRIFQNAVTDRDTEVTVDEVKRAIPRLIETLDTNAFAHFWKDGIPSGREESEVIELKRCRVLVSIARTIRRGCEINANNVAENKSGNLSNSDIVPILQDFCRRDILKEKEGSYEFVIPLFQTWLSEKGASKLIADTLGDELADALQRAEDAAYVTTPEIATLIEKWPLYRGRRVTAEDVRGWLSQRKSFQDQRLLFKLLQNLRFVSEDEAREKLRTAHSMVKRHTTAFTPETRSQRRFDVMVTYIDGPAKSGSRYADRYAEENLISTSCVVAPDDFSEKVQEHEEKRGVTVNGIIIIDDIAATGQSLAANVEKFARSNAQFIKDRNITVVVVALLATREADDRIRASLQRLRGIDMDFRSCEIIEDRHFSFREGNGIWMSTEEADHAKSLVSEIGRSIYKDGPLGIGELGLLVVFYDTCPNNTLPILHSRNSSGWKPLFERPKN